MEVVVYGKPDCPYCEKAKSILDNKNIEYTYLDISEDQEAFNYIKFEKGFATVPQIFVNGEYHGESDSANTVGDLQNKRVVLKRDGNKEPFHPDKLNSMAEWAVAGRKGVNWSSIAMEALKKLPDDGLVTSKNIQDALIQACLDKESFQHNKVAGRLLLGDLRNSSIAPTSFPEFYEWVVEEGYWREMDYSEEDIQYLSTFIDHDYDLNYGYPAVRQFLDKYMRYSKDGFLVELPQYMYMGVAMSLFEGGDIEDVVMYYLKARANKINIPSPILSGQRTKSNIGVSCVITTAGDSLHGIEAAKHIAFMATASSAGLGVEYDVRSPKDDVRNGYAKAGGKLPHYKSLNAIVKEVTQSARGGSATVSFECIDPEIYNLLRLKLPRSPEERRIELLDYSFKINHDLLKRASKRKKWALVSKVDYPELYDEFYSKDTTRFAEIMDSILEDDSAKKTVLDAYDIVDLYLEVRSETGREYRYNVTEGNRHTPFKETIRLSNLCQEVLLPTKPYNHITELYKYTYEEGDGITAQCFLSAIDVNNVEDDKDYEETAYIVLKSLDNLIDKMDYPFPQFKATAQGYRSVGVGITNLATKIALSGKSYNDTDFIHEIAERHYYFLLKGSLRLAKERGEFSFIDKTKWKEGWTPLTTYNRNVDKVAAPVYNYDWDNLADQIKVHGVRFSVTAAHMPCESSSTASGSMNGLYPCRSTMIYKGSKKGRVQVFAPYSDEYDYELAWDLHPKSILNMYAVIQKFTDQTSSADTYVDFSKYEGKKQPKSEMMDLFFYGNMMGVKTLYYSNSKTGRGEVAEKESGCESCSL